MLISKFETWHFKPMQNRSSQNPVIWWKSFCVPGKIDYILLSIGWVALAESELYLSLHPENPPLLPFNELNLAELKRTLFAAQHFPIRLLGRNHE